MYDNSNVQWFSQTLLTYKDKAYATDGYLRLSISTNTEDFKFFNPPMLNISISNNYQKSINLNIQNAKDLLRAFKSVLDQLNGNELNLQRKYQKDTILHFTFKVDPNNNTRIVIIEIRSNESDFTKIVIPLESVFESFASCIRGFTEQYMFVSSQLLIQSVQSQSTQIIHQLPSLIKGISSQIISQIPSVDEFPDSRVPEPEDAMIEQSKMTINDLDAFLEDKLNSINIPEIDNVEKPKTTQEVDGLIIKHFLDNDLMNLENAMSNYFMTPAPLLEITKDIGLKIGTFIKNENFSVMPGIDENSLKSLVYLSKLFSTLTYHHYLNNNAPIPASMPILKYNPSSYTDENLQIAYDLFLINLYIRTVRRRLENKIEDAIENKGLFYIQLRCFTDPLVFSFLDKIDKNNLSSIIITRYRYYDSIGFFDSYKNKLESSKCPKITESDIASTVDEAIEKAVGKSPNIDKLHENIQDVNSLKVRSQNTIKLEQIINEILPLEIAEKTGKDLKNKTILNQLKEEHNISDEMINLFFEKNKKQKSESQIENKHTTSNLERLIRSQFKDEIPEQYRDSFLKYLIDLGDKKFDILNCEYPIDEFGDNIIKALYLWDPENDPVITKNYKRFFLKVEEELMDRDLILFKLKTLKEKTKSTGEDWNFIVED